MAGQNPPRPAQSWAVSSCQWFSTEKRGGVKKLNFIFSKIAYIFGIRSNRNPIDTMAPNRHHAKKISFVWGIFWFKNLLCRVWQVKIKKGEIVKIFFYILDYNPIIILYFMFLEAGRHKKIKKTFIKLFFHFIQLL